MNARLVDILYRHDPTFRSLATDVLGVTSADDFVSAVYDRDFSKMCPDPSEVSVPGAPAGRKTRKRGRLVPVSKASLPQSKKLLRRMLKPVVAGAAGATTLKAGQEIQQYRAEQGYTTVEEPRPHVYGKADLEVCKADDDKRQVFGWASVTHVDGKPVVDRQGDFIELDEVEKSAYDYVLDSRIGGAQHRREGDAPFHAADLIESFVVTDDKASAMGIPQSGRRGWWVGFQVHDEDTWQDVKSGRKTGFSVHGRGKRENVSGLFTPEEVHSP